MKRVVLSGGSLVLLFALVALVPRFSVLAQERFEVLDWQGELTWNKLLIQQMHAQYAEREDAFWAAVTSEEGARAYREKIEKRYKEMLGSFPAESPLNETVTGTIQRDGYRIEKLIYESFPDHHVTANLYVPSGDGPFPGILFFCGHEREAKATASYQRTAMLLAKNGFVVLVIDPISQGERFQLTDEEGVPLTRGGTTTHTLLSAGSNLVGTDVVNYEYWDNKRGLDYLLSRPEVNEDEIGAIGNSGGATMVTYFMGLNERVDVAVLSSYVTKRSRSMEVLGPQDGCQWLPYEGANGLEIVDFLLMKAPVPTLTLAGRYDTRLMMR